MIHNTSYRLGEYKIIDDEHGDLWWETHVGFGSLRTGKCFIFDDILFIKPTQISKPGFLKGEFVDNLKKLKQWNRTKYYCTSYRLCGCESGKIVVISKNEIQCAKANETMMQVCKNNKVDNASSKCAEKSYKLSRYEIVDKKDGRFFWKTFNGLGGVNCGRCKITDNIIFIGPRETDVPGLTKNQFMRQLNRLPNWNGTRYYCPRYTIYNTQTGGQGFETVRKKKLTANVDKRHVAETKPVETSGHGITRYVKNVPKKDYLMLFLAVSFFSVRHIFNFMRKSVQVTYKLARMIFRKWL